MWGQEGERGAPGQERSGLAGQEWGLDRSVLGELQGARGVCLSSLQSVAALQPGACCFWEVRGRWAGVKASV